MNLTRPFNLGLLKKLTLQFNDPSTEARYQASIEPIWKVQVRSALLLASSLYLMVALLDFYIIPEKALSLALSIHISQTVLFSLFGFYLFRTSSRGLHSTLAISAVVIAWSNHLIIVIIGGSSLLFAEAYLMLIWIWLVSGISLSQSIKLNLIFIGMLEAVLFAYNPFDLSTTLSHQYFIFVSLLLGSLGAYLTEFYKRQNFINLEKVAEQASALVTANDQLRHAQKMEAIGTLVGGIAHDFNNTLAAITGNIYLTKEEVKDLPDTLERLENIEGLAFRSADMVKQLLAFSRKGIINMKPMELSPFLDQLSKLHEVIMPADIEFQHNHDNHENIFVRGDENQLEQVILNLLSNARDAVAGVKNPTIRLQLEKWTADGKFKRAHPEIESDTFARISVMDNGCGIDKESLAHLFEPFYTTKTTNEGTGLGLSMALGTLQSHGGTILVETEQGKGSSFQLYLPLLEGAGSFSVSNSVNESVIQKQTSATVLLADDDEAVLKTVASTLERLGHSVLIATDGLSAIETYKANSSVIELIILDIVMPKMGGIEAFKEIKRINSSAKVIFLTGYDSNQELNGETMTEEKVVMKPFNVAEFSQLLGSTLDH